MYVHAHIDAFRLFPVQLTESIYVLWIDLCTRTKTTKDCTWKYDCACKFWMYTYGPKSACLTSLSRQIAKWICIHHFFKGKNCTWKFACKFLMYTCGHKSECSFWLAFCQNEDSDWHFCQNTHSDWHSVRMLIRVGTSQNAHSDLSQNARQNENSVRMPVRMSFLTCAPRHSEWEFCENTRQNEHSDLCPHRLISLSTCAHIDL